MRQCVAKYVCLCNNHCFYHFQQHETMSLRKSYCFSLEQPWKKQLFEIVFRFFDFHGRFPSIQMAFSNFLFTSTFFPRFFSPMIASMNRRWNKRGYCVRCSARREHKLNVFFFCLWFSYRHLFIPIGFVLMNFFAASQQMYRAICVQCWRNTLPEYHIKSDWQWVDVRLHESEQRRKMIENVGQPKSSNQPSKWLS